MERPCKACGRRLLFIKNTEGKIVPLDKQAPVYEVKSDLSKQKIASLTQENFYVSHFATCPKASELSASKMRGSK